MATAAPPAGPSETTAPSLGEAFERCQAYTKARASNFYYAFLSLPKPKRSAIYATYAFAGTVDDIVDAAGAGDEQRRALAEATSLLEAAYASETRDWLGLALSDAVIRYAIPKPYFLDLIAGMEQDVRQDRYETFAELEDYCYRAASVIGLICIEIFGYDRGQRDTAIAAAIDLGKALQLTNIMRDLVEDAERGRVYLAQEDLRRFGYSEVELRAGMQTDAFRALMAEYAARAHAFYASGQRLIPLLDGPRSRMCCNGLQGVYRGLLREIEQRDYDVYSERVRFSKSALLAQMLRLWLAGALRSRRLRLRPRRRAAE